MAKAKDAALGAHLHLVSAVEANKTDLAHLDGVIQKYALAVGEFQQATQVQTALMASKQDASKRVQETRGEADRIGTIVRASLRQNYGSDSEKLVEFGLQPFRGRARKAKPAVEVPEVPETPSRAGAPAAPDRDEQ